MKLKHLPSALAFIGRPCDAPPARFARHHARRAWSAQSRAGGSCAGPFAPLAPSMSKCHHAPSNTGSPPTGVLATAMVAIAWGRPYASD